MYGKVAILEMRLAASERREREAAARERAREREAAERRPAVRFAANGAPPAPAPHAHDTERLRRDHLQCRISKAARPLDPRDWVCATPGGTAMSPTPWRFYAAGAC